MKAVPVPLNRHQSATAVGDELRTVVEADPDRAAALFGEAVQASDNTIGIDGTLHVTGESLPGELIDDV